MTDNLALAERVEAATDDLHWTLAPVDFEQCDDCNGYGVDCGGVPCETCRGEGVIPIWSEPEE